MRTVLLPKMKWTRRLNELNEQKTKNLSQFYFPMISAIRMTGNIPIVLFNHYFCALKKLHICKL